jgi:hypothetical protein
MGEIRKRIEELKKVIKEECGYEPNIRITFYGHEFEDLNRNKANNIADKLIQEIGGKLIDNNSGGTFWIDNEGSYDRIADFTAFYEHQHYKEVK